MPKKKVSPEKSLMGKKSRAKGQRFEAKVRQNLEELGWIVAKWTNTVDYEKNRIVPAKRKYNPFLKALSVGTGFPDFICFRRKKIIINKGVVNDIPNAYKTETGARIVSISKRGDNYGEDIANGAFMIPCAEEYGNDYDIIGLEVKGNGYLDQIEKGMCIWLLENKIFSRILIARKAKKNGEIEYIDFNVKYNNK